jgi:hypothetical protein
MASNRTAKVASAAAAVQSSPYVRRVVEDEDLRENVRAAVESMRVAYGRLSNGKAPYKAVLEDKKLQKSLQEAATSLRDAGAALRAGPPPKRKRRLGRKLFVLIVGAGLVLAFSESLRNKVLDALFGKEEEFEYTSTPPPPTPAPSPPPSESAATTS